MPEFLPVPYGADLSYMSKKEIYLRLSGWNNPNAPTEWNPTQNGEFVAEPGQFVQTLTIGHLGWHDTVLKVGKSGELLRTRHNDPNYILDKPWWNGFAWRQGYYRVFKEAPYGTWYNEVWPKPAITVNASYCKIHVEAIGSAAESLVVNGTGNEIYVNVESGEQSRLMQDRAAVVVNGNSNVLRGYATHPMTALHIRGSYNKVRDFVGVAGEVGDDIGRFYFSGKGGYKGTSVSHCQSITLPRKYPALHLTTGFYFDDKHSNAVLKECTAIGPSIYGAFFHGGSDCKVTNFVSMQNLKPVEFAAYSETGALGTRNRESGTKVM